MSCSLTSSRNWLKREGYVSKDNRVLKDLRPAINTILKRGRNKFNTTLPESVNYNDVLYKTKNGRIGFYKPFFEWVDRENAKVARINDVLSNLELQIEGTEGTVADESTLDKVKEVIKKMGVSLQDLSEYLKGNPDVPTTGINALADLMHNVIAVAQGKENVALTEEMVHIATAVLEQTNPQLITQIISRIGRYKIYKDTFEEYKDNPLYQLANGKPDIRKIKKEAADKLISELIINDSQGNDFFPELRDDTIRAVFRNIWQKILNFFNQAYRDTGIDIFETASNIIMNEDFGTADVIVDDNIYLQVSDAQKDFQRRIEDTKNKINKKHLKDEDSTFHLDTEKVDNWYELVSEPGKALKRVTDRVKKWYRAKFRDKNFSEAEKVFNEFKRDAGTKYHEFFEMAHDRFFNPDGTLKAVYGPRPVLTTKADNKIYNKLEKYYKDLITEYSKDGKTPLFFSEVMVYDPKEREAGTIDLLIVEQDGTTNIYDWKFMSVASGAKDVAWFKQGAYNIQLKRYKNILQDFYGVEKIGKNRAIPILFDIKTKSTLNTKDKTYRINDIEIGDVNPTTIEDLKTAPISEESESTGIEELDDLIKKLNAVHSKISSEEVTTDEEKEFKKERLNILKKATRTIQATLDVEPLVEVISIMKREGENIIYDYENYFKDKNVKDKFFTDEVLSDFSESLSDYIAISDAFGSIGDGIINLLYKAGDEDLAVTSQEKKRVEHAKQLAEQIQQESLDIRNNNTAVKKLSQEFADKFIGERNLVKGLLDANKEVKSLGSWFRGVSELSLPALDVLFKSVTNAKSKASRNAFDRLSKMMAIKDKLEKRGGDIRKIIDPIYQKDSKGKRLNKLVYKYDRKFYDTIDENARSAKPNASIISKNIDKKAYLQAVDDLIAKKMKYYRRIYTDKNLLIKLEIEERRKYDIRREDFIGYSNYLIKKFPSNEWISEEYKNLQKDEDLFALYNFINETNEKANEIGYIDNKVKNTFLPFIRKGFAESLAWDFSLSAIQKLGDDLTVRADDVGYGAVDELTKELVNTIPKYYTRDFTLVDDAELERRTKQFISRKNREPNEEEIQELRRDMSDVSEDLFKNLSLYVTHLEKYNYLSQIEGQLNLVKEIEQHKKHLETTVTGNVNIVDGEAVQIAGNETNTRLYTNFLNAMLYEHKYPISSTDIPLGIGSAIEYGKKLIGKVTGKPYEPKENPSATSMMKTIEAGNRYFQLKTLGLNIVSGFANLFGVSIQMNAQGGVYFKSREFGKNALKLIGNRFNQGEEREMLIQLMNTFMPLKDDPNYELMKKAGMSKLTQENFSDMLMVFMRSPELHVERSLFVTLLENSMIEDGRIVNIREHVKNKYSNRYKNPSEFRQVKKQIESEIAQLQKDSSIWSTKKLEDGKLVVPGLDLTNQEEIQRLTNLTRRLSRNATGSLSDSDMNRINMNIFGKSALVFKNWIPKLVDTRFGEFRKVSDDFSVEIGEDGLTTGEKYDIGRARLFGYVLTFNIVKGAQRINNILAFNEKGALEIDKLYHDFADTYVKRTGAKIKYNPDTGEYTNFITKDEFTDLIRTNLRNQLKELTLLLTLFSVTLAVPPPDDDMTKSEKNAYRQMNKIINRFISELSFFYSPGEYQNLLSGNMFPVLGVVKDMTRFIKHTAMETTGLDLSDPTLSREEVFKKAQPVKYGAKLFPLLKELLNYGAMIDEQFAKDYDITIQDSF